MSNTEIFKIKNIHTKIEKEIEYRLNDFHNIWLNGTDEVIFGELIFCIFTPQSKARSCWTAIEKLQENDFLINGSQEEIANSINGVRFHKTKAERVIKARHQFFESEISLRNRIDSFTNPKQAREWLVSNVNGLGFKEASHFLRNIGMGQKLAILDRHILRNLVTLGIINEIPATITKKHYLEIELKMSKFSKSQGIPMDHLDMVLWYKEAGELFK